MPDELLSRVTQSGDLSNGVGVCIFVLEENSRCSGRFYRLQLPAAHAPSSYDLAWPPRAGPYLLPTNTHVVFLNIHARSLQCQHSVTVRSKAIPLSFPPKTVNSLVTEDAVLGQLVLMSRGS